MKSKLIIALTFSAVFMATQMVASPTSNGNLPSKVTEPQMVADGEKNFPIGDRAIHDVVGNVRAIKYKTEYNDYKIEFDEKGMEIWSWAKNRKVTQTNEGIKVSFETYNDVEETMEETIWEYDKEGRALCHGWGGDCGIKYDNNNKIISSTSTYDGGYAECMNTYDSEGFLIKQIVVEKSEYDGSALGTSTTTYKVLAKDDHGNWTKRMVNGKEIEERTIEYYIDATVDQCLKYCDNKRYKYNSIIKDSYFIDSNNNVFLVNESVKSQLTEALASLFLPLYNEALDIMNRQNEKKFDALKSYSYAAEIFESISRFKDSKEKEVACYSKIEETANSIIKEGNATLDKYKDSTGIDAYIMCADLRNDMIMLRKNYVQGEDLDFVVNKCDTQMKTLIDGAYNEAVKATDESIKWATQSNLDKSIYLFNFFVKIPSYKESSKYIDKLTTLKSNIEKGIKQTEDLKPEIIKTLDEITEVSKQLKIDKINFYKSAPTSFYKRFNFKGYSISQQTNIAYVMSCILDTTLASYCPIHNYKITTIAQHLKSGDIIAVCQIDKPLPGKLGDYETYNINFVFNTNGEMLVKQLSRYTKKSVERVRNNWDELKDNDSKILAKSKECKNIVSAYSNYMKTADKTTEEKLGKIVSNQEKILSAINGSNAKDLDNKVKALKDKSIESVIKEIQQ